MTELKHMSRLRENYPQFLSINHQTWGPDGVVWLSFGPGFLSMDLKYASESKSSAFECYHRVTGVLNSWNCHGQSYPLSDVWRAFWIHFLLVESAITSLITLLPSAGIYTSTLGRSICRLMCCWFFFSFLTAPRLFCHPSGDTPLLVLLNGTIQGSTFHWDCGLHSGHGLHGGSRCPRWETARSR